MHGLFFWSLILLATVWILTGFYVGLRHTRRSENWQKGKVDFSTKVAFLSVCTVAGFPMIVAIGAMLAWGIASEAMRRK
jgi:fatty acid desaturase